MIIEALRGFTRFFKLMGRFIWSGIEKGMRRDDVYKYVTLRGEYYYPYRYFLSDYIKAKGLYNRMYRARFVRRDRRISERFYVETDIFMRRKYLTTFKIEAINLKTGERFETGFSLYHDSIEERGVLEKEALSKFTHEGVTDIEVERIYPTVLLKRSWG